MILWGISIGKVATVDSASKPSSYHYPGMIHKRLIANLLCKSGYTKTDLENVGLTLTAGKGWHRVPLDHLSIHLGCYLSYLFLGDLVWLLQNNAFSDQLYEEISVDYSEWASEKKTKVEVFEELEKLSCEGYSQQFREAVEIFRDSVQRSTFATEKGEIELGPITMAQDDLVFVLHGLDVPFILWLSGSAYVVIGESDIRSLMQGKAIGKAIQKASELGYWKANDCINQR